MVKEPDEIYKTKTITHYETEGSSKSKKLYTCVVLEDKDSNQASQLEENNSHQNISKGGSQFKRSQDEPLRPKGRKQKCENKQKAAKSISHDEFSTPSTDTTAKSSHSLEEEMMNTDSLKKMLASQNNSAEREIDEVRKHSTISEDHEMIPLKNSDDEFDDFK